MEEGEFFFLLNEFLGPTMTSEVVTEAKQHFQNPNAHAYWLVTLKFLRDDIAALEERVRHLEKAVDRHENGITRY